MKKKSGTSLLKWAVLFVLAFVLSLPAMPETSYAANSYTVTVASGYLALRNAKAFDSRNEIGQLYTGETVEVQDASDSRYWTVYSSKLGMSGYVNRSYLTNGSDTRTVSVASGYLALRNGKAFDSKNEVGRLYSGDTVQVANTEDATYWLVYAPSLGKGGYVNKDYLIGGSTGTAAAGSDVRTVSVASGYLALRNAKAYDSRNEIGQLYTGDTVTVQDTSDPTYWYVYSPKYGMSGYVNRNYLTGGAAASTPSTVKTVRVASGYLALRNAKAYDDRNEIGQLYTGDTVTVQDTSDPTYWYVFSPKYNCNGYVNKDYLY